MKSFHSCVSILVMLFFTMCRYMHAFRIVEGMWQKNLSNYPHVRLKEGQLKSVPLFKANWNLAERFVLQHNGSQVSRKQRENLHNEWHRTCELSSHGGYCAMGMLMNFNPIRICHLSFMSNCFVLELQIISYFRGISTL